MALSVKKILLLAALAAIALKLILIVAIFLYPNVSAAGNIEANARELINLTNAYRAERGLNQLRPNARLTQAAVNKAGDLLSRQYFDHTSPEGRKFSDWIKDVNYQYFYVGENLAIDFDDNREIFQAWLASPKHLENIIKPQYQEIGIAVVEGKYQNRQTTVVVQLFGSRVLGINETTGGDWPSASGANNYFPAASFWNRLISLKNLEQLNQGNNYFLIIAVGICLVVYLPAKKKSQIKVRQPIINRYQAKTFRE